jgi:microcystin-dependent protein
MSDFFLGDIRWFPYKTIPAGWHICDGTLLNIQSNAALYSVIGFAYGGDGKTTFGLPDLRGRTIMGWSNSQLEYNTVGKSLGAETVTITTVQMPAHNHDVAATTDTGNAPVPSNSAVYASPLANPKTPDLNIYGTPTTTSSVALASSTVTSSGGGQEHPNMQPFLTLTACIAVQGLYPQFP